LSDGILIKNNHIALAGGAVPALERALRNRRGSQTVEIEVRSLEEFDLVVQQGAEAILLDNMTPDQVGQAVERIRKLQLAIPLEASGGITLENVRAYADTGVDFISVGALTHSVAAVDLSMRISPV
jgi:nicotinate-nucleotide pyrophosphorylase (carboxylating)